MKRHTLIIKKASEENLPALAAIENACFKVEVFSRRRIRYLLSRSKSIFLVALDKEKVVGYIVVLLRKHLGLARGYSLCIHPDYRRLGVGGKLLEKAEELLMDMGYRKITLEVGIDNTPALNLYIGKGYSVDKLLPKYYEDGGDALHLVKRLTP